MIPGEAVAAQHRMLVMETKGVRKRTSPRERTKRTQWWKLNQEELGDAFISKAREHKSAHWKPREKKQTGRRHIVELCN